MLEAAFFLPPPLSGSPTLSLSFCPAQAAAVTGDSPLTAHPGTPVCRQEPPPAPSVCFQPEVYSWGSDSLPASSSGKLLHVSAVVGVHTLPLLPHPSLTSQPAQQPQVKTQLLFTFVGTGGVRDSVLQENP